MLIINKTRRTGGSIVTLGTTDYHFCATEKDPDGDHVCEVKDKKHIEAFLKLPTYEAGGKVDKDVQKNLDDEAAEKLEQEQSVELNNDFTPVSEETEVEILEVMDALLKEKDKENVDHLANATIIKFCNDVLDVNAKSPEEIQRLGRGCEVELDKIDKPVGMIKKLINALYAKYEEDEESEDLDELGEDANDEHTESLTEGGAPESDETEQE